MTTNFDALLADNKRLHVEIQYLLKQARVNQEIMQRHQAFDLRLIASSTFRELIETVSRVLPETFRLETVTLVLVDTDYGIRRILRDLQIKLEDFPRLLFLETIEPPIPHLSIHKPLLSLYQKKLHHLVFPNYEPASVAILPLTRHQTPLGYLALGSASTERFTAYMATDFLERLASVVAICLENVINNERLKHIGLTDPLTGVNNRRYIEQRMQEEIVRAQRERSAISCLFIDIDYFKLVNDRFGHHSGDDVLREVATCIKKELRLNDSLGRFGGEEFVALLTQATLQDAARIGERIRSSVAQYAFSIPGVKQTLTITVSIGVSAQVPPSRDIPAQTIRQSLLQQADQALYHAKDGGRNRVVLAENGTDLV